jgi:hypothetical protein
MKLHRSIILGLVLAVMVCKTSSMMPVAYAAEPQITDKLPVPKPPGPNRPPVLAENLSCIPSESAEQNLKQAGQKPIFGVFDGKQVIMVFVNSEQQTYVIVIIPANNPEVVCILSKGEGYNLKLENLSNSKSETL